MFILKCELKLTVGVGNVFYVLEESISCLRATLGSNLCPVEEHFTFNVVRSLHQGAELSVTFSTF